MVSSRERTELKSDSRDGALNFCHMWSLGLNRDSETFGTEAYPLPVRSFHFA